MFVWIRKSLATIPCFFPGTADPHFSFRKCGSVNSLRKHQALFQKPQTPQTVDAQIRICDSPGSKCTFAQEFTDPRHDPAQLDVYTHMWIRDSLGKRKAVPWEFTDPHFKEQEQDL